VSSNARTPSNGGNKKHELARLGVDIGGTFTDVVLEVGAKRHSTKILTTHQAPQQAVIQGVEQLVREAGLRPADLGLIVHGTTLATNALIERRGARTAFLTTEGFRDVLEMRSEFRYEQYDLGIRLPEPLIPRQLRLPIAERISAFGDVLLPLDEVAVRLSAEKLRDAGVEAVAIGFMHAYANPLHEQRTRDLLLEMLPGVSVSLSSDVSPEMREFERFSTTCANAYVQPLMSRYLAELEKQLQHLGYSCPLLLMLSTGGLVPLKTAALFPVRLVESGPAGGAIFATNIAAENGVSRCLSFDMGGTTAKICFVDDFEPNTSREFEVARVYRYAKGSGLPLRIPVIEMVEIGAGGGSIATVDELGRVRVGPESAGSEPGPVCYGLGGAKPTVTDANSVLGRLDPAYFAAGSLKLDVPSASKTLGDTIGIPLNLNGGMAAYAITEIVDENMASAARVHGVESGRSVSEYTMIAYGGGGPLHACSVAGKLGIKRVLVPTSAGVGSAVGFLRAPISYEVARSSYGRIKDIKAERINDLLSAMATEATEIVLAVPGVVDPKELRWAMMRYAGQGHEIVVPLPAKHLVEADIAMVAEEFERRYRALYSRIVPNAVPEMMSLGLRISSQVQLPAMKALQQPQAAAKPQSIAQHFDAELNKYVELPVFRRDDLQAGAVVEGPALIVEAETTLFVTHKFRAFLNLAGVLECHAK
jgi:N-methylhydantoinase A